MKMIMCKKAILFGLVIVFWALALVLARGVMAEPESDPGSSAALAQKESVAESTAEALSSPANATDQKKESDPGMVSSKSTFSQASVMVQQQLVDSLKDLAALRERIVAEKLPMNSQLHELEGELLKVRMQYQSTARMLDSRTLDLNNLKSEIKSRQDEATYIANLLGEYVRNFEARLHIVEVQRYRDILETAKLAAENESFSQQEIYEAQAALVAESLERLRDATAGTSFQGTAVVASGKVKAGTFVLVGPAALFQSSDEQDIGTAEQRLGSLEPTVIGFESLEDIDAAKNVVKESTGHFPVDPTLGSAHKIEATQDSLWEHIRKGGPVMVPILGLAGAAFLVGLFKWFSMMSLRKPSEKSIKALLHAVARHDADAAMLETNGIGGPIGKMLGSGVEHIKEPIELIEEVMYETVLATRLKVQSLLPFIAISAASSPLLGLLGTVTGIINTFKLITVFGSGDVKTLSSGISEALITTEFGLIVAIPSLLLHAFLSRKARGIIDEMEKAAIAFTNQVSKTPYPISPDVSRSRDALSQTIKAK